jgi:hypothetical protein
MREEEKEKEKKTKGKKVNSVHRANSVNKPVQPFALMKSLKCSSAAPFHAMSCYADFKKTQD